MRFQAITVPLNLWVRTSAKHPPQRSLQLRDTLALSVRVSWHEPCQLRPSAARCCSVASETLRGL